MTELILTFWLVIKPRCAGRGGFQCPGPLASWRSSFLNTDVLSSSSQSVPVLLPACSESYGAEKHHCALVSSFLPKIGYFKDKNTMFK